MHLLTEGKTKWVFFDPKNPDQVILKSKSAITAHNDPSFTNEFPEKSRYATETTCNVFELLRSAGIPTAFVRRLDETSFVCTRVTMIPLEVVIRRYADGSILKRFPELQPIDGVLHRFNPLREELFLKTTGGSLTVQGIEVVSGLTTDEDDPLIRDPLDSIWELCHPKYPPQDPRADLSRFVAAEQVLTVDGYVPSVKTICEIATNAFKVLEAAWDALGYVLVDFKVELGITPIGSLVIADVIDNDSWRLRQRETGTDLSKESFRQGAPLEKVADNYRIISELSGRLR